MRNWFILTLALLIFLWLGACTKEPPVAVKAENDIHDSFRVLQSPDSQPRIAIRKAALEKEFLLHAVLIPQSIVALGRAIKSRIVAFRKRGENLYLLEATAGHSVTAEMPQTLLLAEFPILSEDPEEIVFDFNAGMSRIFVAQESRGQDLSGSQYSPEYGSLKVRFSYLEAAKTSENHLIVRQIAQVASTWQDGEFNNTVEAKYYLVPYQPNPQYKPLISPGISKVGFFEVAPKLLPGGGSVIHATRWDTTKPIVFAISPNTPPHYVGAIRDGILYWNQAFSKVRLEVIQAPTGVTAPDFHYNLIQWVTWDEADSAYADVQVDPRTGEILHAQIYLTSIFALGAKAQARLLLSRLQTHANKPQISLAGFVQQHSCAREQPSPFARSLVSLGASDASDERILKASQDTVRETTAHEVGHVLGLRHNFAGSLGANFLLTERTEIVQNYFETDVPRGMITSSSVMDYQLAEEAMLTGAQIRQGEILLYDKLAIAALYEGGSLTTLPTFCTDSGESLLGCKQYDAGASVLEYEAWSFKEALRLVSHEILNKYINAVSGFDGRNTDAIEKVALDPSETARKLLEPIKKQMEVLFAKDRLFLTVRKQFPYVGSLNLEEVRDAEQGYLEGELARLGGLEAVLPSLPPSYARTELAKFESLLADPTKNQGVGSSGKEFGFKNSELEVMQKTARKFFGMLGDELTNRELSTLKGAKFPNNKIGNDLASVLAERVRKYLFATTGEFIDEQIELSDQATLVRLPVFIFPTEIRVAAWDLLNPQRSENPTWGTSERAAIQAELEKIFTDAIWMNLESLVMDQLPSATADWVRANLKVKAALSPAP